MQKATVEVSEPLPDVAAADLPRAGAHCFRAARVGDTAFALGDVVALEDDDEDAEEPLLGLVQCIWHGGDAGRAELQVRQLMSKYVYRQWAAAKCARREQGHFAQASGGSCMIACCARLPSCRLPNVAHRASSTGRIVCELI